MKQKIKLGLMSLLAGASILSFSNASAQQSETGFWIRQRPTFTDYGATARDYWANTIDNNEQRASMTKASWHAMNLAMGRDDSQVELLGDGHENYKEMLRVGDNSYVDLPKDYWETHTRKKVQDNSIEEKKQELARWNERVEKLQKSRDPHGLEDKIVFTANRWIDLNENGYIDWSEFQGVKNSFEEGDDLKVIVHNTYQDAKQVRLKIYGPNGEVILNASPKSKLAPNDLFWAGNDSDAVFRSIFKNAGAGSYKAVVYFDDQSVATQDFEIKRNPRTSNVQESPTILKQIINLDDKIIGLDEDTVSGKKIVYAKNAQKGNYKLLVDRVFDKKQTSNDKTLANLDNQEVCYNVYYGVYLIPKAKD